MEIDGILNYLFQRGIRLEALFHQGAVFPYPDSLRTDEWVALHALKVARATNEEVTINTGAQVSALEAAVRRKR